MQRTNGGGNGADSAIEFSHDEPATFPTRTYSGRAVRPRIIRAMEATHKAFKEAAKGADKLNQILRRSIRPQSIPPSANIGGR